MDLETENQIASILMKEAAELRRQAEKEGVQAYLREKNVRFRPNSRFLTATVLGVQQANKVAEVNDMWRVRRKELEMNDKLKGTTTDKTSRKDHHSNFASSSKPERDYYSYSSDDGGLKDEEVEQFLRSRAKRGRGGVGPRMDEPGPYLPRTGSDSRSKVSESYDVREKEEWERRVLGPEKPASLMSKSIRYIEDEDDEEDWKKSKKVKVEKSKKHSKEYKRKEDKRAKEEREERRSKHRKRKRSHS